MTGVKLQYSVICEAVKDTGFMNIMHGFRTGLMKKFYIVNKWVWDTLDDAEDGFYQETGIVYNNEVLALSRSNLFIVKLGHTHHNLFKDIKFIEEGKYRVRVNLYDREDNLIKEASLEYPVFVRSGK